MSGKCLRFLRSALFALAGLLALLLVFRSGYSAKCCQEPPSWIRTRRRGNAGSRILLSPSRIRAREKSHAPRGSSRRSHQSRPPDSLQFVPKLAFLIYPVVVQRIGATAVTLDEARTACAIERFRLAQGRLPTELGELVPAYLKELPADVVGQGPLRYLPRRRAVTGFIPSAGIKPMTAERSR